MARVAEDRPLRLTIDLGPEAARAASEAGSSPLLARRIENERDRYEMIRQRKTLPLFADAEWTLLRKARAGTIGEPAAVIGEFTMVRSLRDAPSPTEPEP